MLWDISVPATPLSYITYEALILFVDLFVFHLKMTSTVSANSAWCNQYLFLAEWNNCLNKVMITAPRACNIHCRGWKSIGHCSCYALLLISTVLRFCFLDGSGGVILRLIYSVRAVDALWRLLSVTGLNSLVLCHRISGHCQSGLSAGFPAK